MRHFYRNPSTFTSIFFLLEGKSEKKNKEVTDTDTVLRIILKCIAKLIRLS